MSVFEAIYDTHRWKGSESRSGWASGMEATAGIRLFLPALVDALGVRSVLDAPCGDSNWQPELPGYIGVDIVPAAIEASRQRHPGREFAVMDVTTDRLPHAQLVLCRDLLIHLPVTSALAALGNIRRTGAIWLLGTTTPGARNADGGMDADALATHGRAVDLAAKPFGLGRPLLLIEDGYRQRRSHAADRWLGLWSL